MTTSRVQLALNVDDIEIAVRRYRDVFGVEPAKRRPGYANFAIDDPPLKLVLFESPQASSPLNHLGVELMSPSAVTDTAQRFADAGLSHTVNTADACCHAVQDKVWVDVPGVPLGAGEVYTVFDDDVSGAATQSQCCAGASKDDAVCCGQTVDGR
jgi:catechol 2,3-dioxygenase-like lactoylglutathione lyase family enzyme